MPSCTGSVANTSDGKQLEIEFFKRNEAFAKAKEMKSENVDHSDLIQLYADECIQLYAHECAVLEKVDASSPKPKYLLQEYNSWTLLEKIIKENEKVANALAEDNMDTNEEEKGESDDADDWSSTDQPLKQHIDKRMQQHKERRMHMILKWLHKATEEELRLDGALESAFKIEKMWENSWQNLSQRGLVSEIDPDAPSRYQDRVLHEDDEKQECMLMESIWNCIRKGDTENAKKLLNTHKQPWRVASLLGLFEEDESHTFGETHGNHFLWRNLCLQLSQNDGNAGRKATKFERAIYASVGGNNEYLLRCGLCNTW